MYLLYNEYILYNFNSDNAFKFPMNHVVTSSIMWCTFTVTFNFEGFYGVIFTTHEITESSNFRAITNNCFQNTCIDVLKSSAI